MMKEIIMRVFRIKASKQKLVTIPKDSNIKAGDYVRIKKIENKDG